MKYKAVFLDNNGTISTGFSSTSQNFTLEFQDDIVEGLQRLQSYGYLLVVVSNQTGGMDGKSTTEDIGRIKDSLYGSYAQVGIYLDGFYYCPHDPADTTDGDHSECESRKPLPGLILRAGDEMGIDLSQSWMVGDILNDVEAGNRAGCKSIMINDGAETRWISGAYRLPEYFAGGLAEASKYIVASENMRNAEQEMDRTNSKPVQQPVYQQIVNSQTPSYL